MNISIAPINESHIAIAPVGGFEGLATERRVPADGLEENLVGTKCMMKMLPHPVLFGYQVFYKAIRNAAPVGAFLQLNITIPGYVQQHLKPQHDCSQRAYYQIVSVSESSREDVVITYFSFNFSSIERVCVYKFLSFIRFEKIVNVLIGLYRQIHSGQDMIVVISSF